MARVCILYNACDCGQWLRDYVGYNYSTLTCFWVMERFCCSGGGSNACVRVFLCV